jgi:hypothetical protein
MRKILLIIGAVAFAPVVYWMGAYTFLMIIGYHPDAIGIELAPLLVEHGKSVEECTQIIHPIPHPFSPSAREQQANCIHRYATLKKDPSACELLMPSSYGLSCVGAARKFLPCLFDDQKNVIWNDGEYHEIPYEKCDAGFLSSFGRACCTAAASKFNPDFVGDCSQFTTEIPLLADQCQYETSMRTLNTSRCAFIKDENIKSACFMVITTLNKHPELRGNYPLNN